MAAWTVWFAAAMVAGVWAFPYLPSMPCWLLQTVCIVLLCSAAAAIRCQRQLWILVALFFALGVLRASTAVWLPADDISNFAGRQAEVLGTVITVPEILTSDIGTSRLKYIVQLTPDDKHHVSGGAAVYQQHEEGAKPLRCGDKVLLTGKVYLPHGYNNPGQIDVAGSMRRQGITARLSVSGAGDCQHLGHDSSWQGYIAEWRSRVYKAMQAVMPTNEAGILNGFIFGGYTGIKSELVKAYAMTGIIHILSVSGTHIALVGGILACVGRLVGFRRYSGLLAVGGIIFYAVISGLSPPVVRSALMGIAAFLAVWAGRARNAVQAFNLTIFLMVAYDPLLIYDISFQLSFGATAGLLFLYPRLFKLCRGPAFIRSAVAITVAAQLGVLPFTAWYFASLSISSLVANIVVVPIVEFVVVSGLGGVLLWTVAPYVGKVIFVACSLLISGIDQLVLLLSAVPYGYITIPAGGFWLGCCYYVLLWWWCEGIPERLLPRPRTVWERWPEQTMVFVAASVAVCIVACCWPAPVKVHFIDVGQGDAALITTPYNHAVLIDTGGSLGSSGFDVGERVVVPYLRHYGVRHLDYMILTHGHQDHAGGAAAVAANIPTGRILIAREPSSPCIQNLRRVHPDSILPTVEGQVIMLDGVRFSIVHAEPVDSDEPQGNEVSSVVRVEYKKRSFLFTGDLSSAGEQAMLQRHTILSVDVLKVGHHGSRTSSSPLFLQAAGPRYAIISVGLDNRFGHPHSDTLQRLSACGAKVLRTDQVGAVVFTTDGQRLDVMSYLNGREL